MRDSGLKNKLKKVKLTNNNLDFESRRYLYLGN